MIRWRWDRRVVREVVATLLRDRRDLIHPFLVAAMTMESAKRLLGFNPEDQPTPREVKQAWKKKAMENHPDRGGDAEVMRQVNVAHDVLTGKQRPDYAGMPFEYEEPIPRTYQQGPSAPVKKERVTWDEAWNRAGIPKQVEWKFATTKSYGGYDGETRNETKSGYVVYGRTDTLHVFVAIFHHALDDYQSHVDRNIYQMRIQTAPAAQDVAKVAPAVIRKLWQGFDGVKGYGAKVYVLPEGTTRFDEKTDRTLYKLRKVSFKQAMGLMGEATPSAWKGKVDVVLELGSNPKGYGSDSLPATLVLNGKPYRLSDQSNQAVWKARVYRFVWGPKGYFYPESKKNLTRIKNSKKVLEWLVNNLKNEPSDLMDGLRAAAERAK